MLGRMGIDTGVSMPDMLATGRWLEQHIGQAVPGMLLKAGVFPRTDLSTR